LIIFKYLINSDLKFLYFLILLEKIKSFKLEFTDSKPTLNFAFVFDDNNVSSRFDLKKLINKSYSKETNSKESVPLIFP
jgi:hypothetical protein